MNLLFLPGENNSTFGFWQGEDEASKSLYWRLELRWLSNNQEAAQTWVKLPLQSFDYYFLLHVQLHTPQCQLPICLASHYHLCCLLQSLCFLESKKVNLSSWTTFNILLFPRTDECLVMNRVEHSSVLGKRRILVHN